MLTLLGKIKSVHGVKGDVVFIHSIPETFDTNLLDALMIELNPKSYIPFFIEHKNETNDDEMIIKFEEIKNREEAVILLNKNVYAPPNLEIVIDNETEWSRLIGFKLLDQNNIEIATINDIYMNSGQILLSIIIDEDEKLIPISDELIIERNEKNKTIKLEIAEGLLEL